MSLLRLPPGPVDLRAIDPASTPGFTGDKAAGKQALAELGDELSDLQERLFAEGTTGSRRRVLLVLQGMDTSGKGGVLRHTVGLIDPQGVRITSFKSPSEEEGRHHFLWRVKRALPQPGLVGVFDRSHYEDAIVPRALGQIDDTEFGQRIRTIERFERGLVDTGVVVVKCLLHLSYDEQRARFVRRLRRPDKQWKFSDADVATRRHWPQFQTAYGEVIGRTSFDDAPWYLVPSDHKWYRNWAVARLLVEMFEALDQRYPALGAGVDVEAMCDALAPPN
jgi:PPK2 family polyphosphate:nucleotide phosphotransferase